MAKDYEIKLDSAMMAQVTAVLEKLPIQVENQVVGVAARKSMKPIEHAAKAILAGRTGTTGLLRESIGIVQRKKRARGTVYTIVGPRTGYKDAETGENPVNIAHLVEFGTKPHLIAPKGQKGALKIQRGVGPTVIVEGAVQHPGAQPKPFMRPAYDAHGREVLANMERELEAGIMKRVEKFERTPR